MLSLYQIAMLALVAGFVAATPYPPHITLEETTTTQAAPATPVSVAVVVEPINTNAKMTTAMVTTIQEPLTARAEGGKPFSVSIIGPVGQVDATMTTSADDAFVTSNAGPLVEREEGGKPFSVSVIGPVTNSKALAYVATLDATEVAIAQEVERPTITPPAKADLIKAGILFGTDYHATLSGTVWQYERCASFDMVCLGGWIPASTTRVRAADATTMATIPTEPVEKRHGVNAGPLVESKRFSGPIVGHAHFTSTGTPEIAYYANPDAMKTGVAHQTESPAVAYFADPDAMKTAMKGESEHLAARAEQIYPNDDCLDWRCYQRWKPTTFATSAASSPVAVATTEPTTTSHAAPTREEHWGEPVEKRTPTVEVVTTCAPVPKKSAKPDCYGRHCGPMNYSPSAIEEKCVETTVAARKELPTRDVSGIWDSILSAVLGYDFGHHD